MTLDHDHFRILIAGVYHPHFPYLWQLAHGLALSGWPALFLAFTPREREWLIAQGERPIPEDVHHLPTPAEPVFSDEEARDILFFSMSKAPPPVKEAHWKGRLQGIGAVMDAALRQHRPEAVLIWNGNEFIGKALAVLARRHGVRTVFFENGYFPGTMQIDARGVNGEASLCALPFDEIRACANLAPGACAAAAALKGLAPAMSLSRLSHMKRFLARRVDLAYPRKFPENLGTSTLHTALHRRRRAKLPMDQTDLPARFVFIPFQVHDDTQILLNSPHFRTMEAFFEHCHAAIRHRYGPAMGIVVKEHPEDLFRHSYADLKARYPDVIWLTRFDVDRLVSDCELVMVVNSSVGLQAIAAGKPVVTYGRSFYARPEICFPIADPSQTDEQLALASQGLTEAMRADVEAYVRYLREVFFVRGTWSKLEVDGVRNSMQKVLSLLAAPVEETAEASLTLRQVA